MNLWVPVSSSYSDSTGTLIAIGAMRVPDIAGDTAALEPLWQMSQSRFAGEATVELVNGHVEVRARISQDLAADKVGKGVYRGFSVALLQGTDGSTRIVRIALVDAPDAVNKSSGAEFLKLSRRPFMKSVLIHDTEVRLQVKQARDRKAEAARITKAQAATNPPPGGPVGVTATEAEHNGVGTTSGGRGRDLGGFGQDQGGDATLAAIRRMLATPYRENEGLVTLLGSRAA
jgi:hypothetical protein